MSGKVVGGDAESIGKDRRVSVGTFRRYGEDKLWIYIYQDRDDGDDGTREEGVLVSPRDLPALVAVLQKRLGVVDGLGTIK